MSRIDRLNKLLSQIKIAQEVLEDDPETKKLANDIFSKIFDEELEKSVKKTPAV
jgi:hypothetical protein